MKVFYERPPCSIQIYGKTYVCDHEVYDRCTLFKRDDGAGIAVIQQRFDPKTKHTWWGEIDPELANDIYLSEKYLEFMDENARLPDEKGLYPTFPVRKVMWSVRIPPVRKEKWETSF